MCALRYKGKILSLSWIATAGKVRMSTRHDWDVAAGGGQPAQHIARIGVVRVRELQEGGAGKHV